MKNNTNALIDFVTSEVNNGFVKVFLNIETFNAIAQSINAKYKNETPLLTWTGRATLESEVGTRVFEFANTTIYNLYDKNSKKNVYCMLESEALALDIPRYVPKPSQEPIAITPSAFFATA